MYQTLKYLMKNKNGGQWLPREFYNFKLHKT
jgi:hypothetical protein